MFDTLSYIGEKLNEERVMWGVGASILLNHYELVDRPNDIDILVGLKDVGKADMILRSIGQKKAWNHVDIYSTEYFYEYVVNGFDVDVMAALSINHSNGVFKHSFDTSSITGTKKVNRIDIPLTSLEDWYVIYQLIPNREKKVEMIENYLLTNGIRKRSLLERALRGELPKEVRDRIERILM